MGLALPKDTRERINRIFEEPDILDAICMFVANGGTVIKLARSWDIPASTVFNWLRKDEERSKAYDKAKADRNEWIVESVLSELQELSLASASDQEGSDLKVSNKIKAAELIARHQRLFVDRVEHSGTMRLEDLVIASYKKTEPQTP